jgi:hypothetical protein
MTLLCLEIQSIIPHARLVLVVLFYPASQSATKAICIGFIVLFRKLDRHYFLLTISVHNIAFFPMSTAVRETSHPLVAFLM